MCIGMNGDLVDKGQYAVSTSNRNFEGRQGTGARTLLASPATAAAAAITGRSHRSARLPHRTEIRRAFLKYLCNPFASFESRTVVLPSTNIDTDQIIPARFLTTTTKEGLGKQAFADWRYDASGAPKPTSF